MKKKMCAALLTLCMVLSLLPTTALAASNQLARVKLIGGTKATANEDCHSYVNYNLSHPAPRNFSDVVRSNLTPLADGTLMVTSYRTAGLLVQYFDQSGKFLSEKTIPNELPLYGGFYAGEENYFLLFGQENKAEDNARETFRLVKYSKDWVRLGQASSSNDRTTLPFNAGSVSMAELGGKLYIHTTQQIYTADDGMNHQANMSFAVDIASMVFTDRCSLADVTKNRKHGYTAHSLNQYIATGADGSLYTADHGDAYPRSMRVAKRDPAKLAAGAGRSDFLSFQGEIGDNFTGAQLGGLAVSSTSVLTVGALSKQDRSDTLLHNVYLAVTDRSNMENPTTVTMLTNYQSKVTTAGNPHLVSLGNDRFMVLWNEKPSSSESSHRFLNYALDSTDRINAVLCYAILDKAGQQLGDIKKTNAILSDCPPVLAPSGKVMWYTADAKETTLYTLDVGDLSALKPVAHGTGLSAAIPTVVPPLFHDGKIPDGWYTISYKGNYLNIDASGVAELRQSAANTYYKVTPTVKGSTSLTIQTADGKYLGTKARKIVDTTPLVTLDEYYEWYCYGPNFHLSIWEGRSLTPAGGATADGTRFTIPDTFDIKYENGFTFTPKGAAPKPAVTAATPSPTKLTVNGTAVSVDAYLINQNNYIKLRDLAYIINGTAKNFDVKWDDAKKAINLTSNTPYTVIDGDMVKGNGQATTATVTTSKIYVDGVEKPLTAYFIGQSNYFRLRDVMQVFNVGVGYDNATSTASLDTANGYVAP